LLSLQIHSIVATLRLTPSLARAILSVVMTLYIELVARAILSVVTTLYIELVARAILSMALQTPQQTHRSALQLLWPASCPQVNCNSQSLPATSSLLLLFILNLCQQHLRYCSYSFSISASNIFAIALIHSQSLPATSSLLLLFILHLCQQHLRYCSYSFSISASNIFATALIHSPSLPATSSLLLLFILHLCQQSRVDRPYC
jgi:hypothetical protein